MKNNPFHGRRAADFAPAFFAAFFCAGSLASQFPRPAAPLPAVHESFDPALQSITTVDAAADYVGRYSRGPDPASLADATDEFVRRRFYHSYSFVDPGENWLAYLAGFVWIDLRSPVRPRDILRHPQAACSQQVIVFQSIARRLGLNAGVVRFDHHMVVAVRIAGEWRLYDPDREISPRSFALSRLVAGDPRVLAIYGSAGEIIGISDRAYRARVSVADVNRNPAAHASLFHFVTQLLSRFGWALFLGLALLRFARSRPSDNPLATSRHALS